MLEEIRVLVDVQLAMRGREAELRAVGCPDRPVSSLAPDFRTAILGDPPLPGVTLPSERLGQLASWVEAHAAWLAQTGLPDVLVHGDFHPGNVISSAGRRVLIDWSDAALTHPLMDAGMLFPFVKDAELRTRWWHAWLDALAPLVRSRTCATPARR